MEGRDVMGLAQTGTGKTAVFALPILNKLIDGKRGNVRALVVAPTRELAEQIYQTLVLFSHGTQIRSVTVYGGVSIVPQVKKIRSGVDIVVGCPGRILDHVRSGSLDLSKVEILVLDEADQMFDMGFIPDIKRLLSHLPAKRQTLLFSATMPTDIKKLAREILQNPLTVKVGDTAPPVSVTHAIYPVSQHLKTELLLELLHKTDTESVLIFARTKHRVSNLGKHLADAGYKAASLQGNLSQNRRQKAMAGFRDGTYQILVATDIAARGIDVSQISHVINYDITDTAEAYIHRIGRTGRAAKTGDAFTLVSNEDMNMVRVIERQLGATLERRNVPGFNYKQTASEKNSSSKEDMDSRKGFKGFRGRKNVKSPRKQHGESYTEY
jgi:ATP-dependent RNA helicase RhlE